MIKELRELAKIADKLDSLGLTKEADTVDSFIKKMAKEVAFVINGVTYYKAENIHQFNNNMADAAEDLMNSNVRPDLFREINFGSLRSDTKWGAETVKIFKAFCTAFGNTDACRGWKNYAVRNGYSPTISGIENFIAENAGKLEAEVGSGISMMERGEGDLGEAPDMSTRTVSEGRTGPASLKDVGPSMRTPTDYRTNNGRY